MRCTASACKKALKERNAADKTTFNETTAPQAAPGDDEHDEMPDGMWVNELEEILGERACVLQKLTKVQRKNGPRSAAKQQFLVRGAFLCVVEDDDEDEDESPEPGTFWVDQDELLHTIVLSDVREALEQRQEAVLAALRPQKKARK